MYETGENEVTLTELFYSFMKFCYFLTMLLFDHILLKHSYDKPFEPNYRFALSLLHKATFST